MLVTDKGQVTIPKKIRAAAGIAPGSEVAFSLEGSKIVITAVGTGVKEDRRAQLGAAAARVRASFSAEFKQLGADEIMNFIRGDEPTPKRTRRGSRHHSQPPPMACIGDVVDPNRGRCPPMTQRTACMRRG